VISKTIRHFKVDIVVTDVFRVVSVLHTVLCNTFTAKKGFGFLHSLFYFIFKLTSMNENLNLHGKMSLYSVYLKIICCQLNILLAAL